MFRKVCNYLAVFSLSLMVFGSSVLATTPVVSTEKNEEIRVDEKKEVNFYNSILVSGGKHSYTIKVEEGKDVKVRFKSSRAATLTVQTPSGELKGFAQDKFFEVKISGAGEYVIELGSLFISQYSLEVFNR